MNTWVEAVIALREAGWSSEEISAVIAIPHSSPQAVPTPAAAETKDEPTGEAEVSEPATPVPPPPPAWSESCPARQGLRHSPVGYSKRGDGRIFGTCACGYSAPARCPHPGQRAEGRNVVCSACGHVLIRNTGFIDNRSANGTRDPAKSPPILGQGDQPPIDAHRGDT